MQFDRSGNRHLICVENRAVDSALAKLQDFECNLNRIKILQWRATLNVRNTVDIECFDLITDLEARLIEILDRASMGMRFYAIGSGIFVFNCGNYARNFGLAEEDISLEIVSNRAKNVYCSNCLIINPSVRDNIFICSGCNTKLEAVEHFSRLKNACLGICADVETTEESSKVK